MKSFFLAVAMLCGSVAIADGVVVTTAQQDAVVMARTGVLRHLGRAGGRREGIAFSTASPAAALRSCCFYSDAMRGRYRIVEQAVVWSPVRRGWFAVIRYE